MLTTDSPVPLIPSLMSIPSFSSLPTIPMISTINPLISFPLHPSLDLNRDSKLHNMMTKYFYYKTLDKWLKKENDMLELLNYLKVTDKGIDVINKVEEYNSNTPSGENQQNIDKKIEFIEKNVLSKEDIYRILKKYVRETSTNWYDLEEKGTYFIKEIIKKLIKSKLVDAIMNKKSNAK